MSNISECKKLIKRYSERAERLKADRPLVYFSKDDQIIESNTTAWLLDRAVIAFTKLNKLGYIFDEERMKWYPNEGDKNE